MLRIGSVAAISGVISSFVATNFLNERVEAPVHQITCNHICIPTREEQIEKLRKQPCYDILVIGGGATGCGIALDAASRGLSVALVEREDFSSGTSSKSTKLIHGGIRYLQKAVMNLDLEQYRMVKEALSERSNLLKIAPHLAYPLAIMLPIYKWWQIPYFWLGVKMYDGLAGRENISRSHFIPKKKALDLFPMLNPKDLYGALIYYDGQHNDSRMNVTLAFTAAQQGAHIANHVEVKELLIDTNTLHGSHVHGAVCHDYITGKTFNVKAKVVVNATGPFTDQIREMENPNVRKLCQPSSGVHVVLPGYYSPLDMGLLDPNTKDGRIIFFLPWENHTVAGTTDSPCEIQSHPSPSEEEVDFILDEIRQYLSPELEVRRGDVLSVWSGIRPLVIDPRKSDTQSLARNHIIAVSPGKMVTVAGGKWTTYRQMAEDVVDCAIKEGQLKPKGKCITKSLKLLGANNWTCTSYIRLVQDYGLDTQVARHLSNTYGDAAEEVVKLCRPTNKRWPVIGQQLHPLFPYVDGEVRYAVKQYARSAIDVIANRTRIAFLNVLAAREALPVIVSIMAEELSWDRQKQEQELKSAKEYLCNDMGMKLNYTLKGLSTFGLSAEELNSYKAIFDEYDKQHKGTISVSDLKKHMLESKLLSNEEFENFVAAFTKSNQNGKFINKNDFLQIMGLVKTGRFGYSMYKKASKILLKDTSVERSGGGV